MFIQQGVFLGELGEILFREPALIKALAHITGGGFIENIPRILPPGVDVVVKKGSWPLPAIYGLIRRLGSVAEEEMYRVFNMGIGMVAVVAPGHLKELISSVSETCWVIGQLERGSSVGITRMQ